MKDQEIAKTNFSQSVLLIFTKGANICGGHSRLQLLIGANVFFKDITYKCIIQSMAGEFSFVY